MEPNANATIHICGSNTLRVVSECIYIITHFACFVKAYLKNGFRFYISESILQLDR